MLNFEIKKTLLIAILGNLLLSGPSYANTCFSKSPNLESQGDNYYNLRDKGLLPRKDQKLLNTFFKSLKGRWSGRAEVLTCFGSMKSPKAARASIKKSSKFSNPSVGNLAIRSTDTYLKQKIIKNSTVKLSYGSSGTFISLDQENRFSAIKKFRISNTRNRIVEEIYSIEQRGNNLHLTINQYTNGYLSSRESWQLKR